MTNPILVSLVALVTLLAPAARAADAPDLLANLRQGHPRLMVLDADVAAVRRAVATDPVAQRWHAHLRAEAERMLSAEPIRHVLIGPRLLDKSRTCLVRVSTLAGLYRLDGDEGFARRAIKEMLTAAAFPDWNPKHFLDTAEMTNALGIGYDWLYDVLTPQERATIRGAIVRLGLAEGMKVYEKGTWWTRATHNWNQVCNGGMTVGALAIADEERELANRVINHARVSIPRAMASFGPDGGWNEGPGYWAYTTLYTTYFLASLETALGTDFGIKATPGYADTGYFRMHFVSPAGETFNYADASSAAGASFPMMWMARALDRPLYAAHERSRVDKPGILHLLFWDGGRTPWPAGDVPTARAYLGVDVAFMRSAWDDPRAVWVGFKGGDNKANHAHLDLGTFNLDALGQRWALDLGVDDYNLPGYFGKNRWTYYRLRTEAHNTLTIDDENQDPSARAPLVAFKTTPGRTFAVADVTAAYKEKLTRWRRGVALLDGRRVTIVDELQAKAPVRVTWNFHTDATVDLAPDGRSATLRKGGETLRLQIASGTAEGGTFKTVSANPPPPQRQNPGVTNLTIQFPGPLTKATIRVVASSPDDRAAAPQQGGEALEKWVAEGKMGG